MKRAILAASIATAFAASSAHASLIDYLGLNHSSAVEIVHLGTTRTVLAGDFHITIDGASATAFCVDLDHNIVKEWTADKLSVTSINGGKAAAFLYDTFKNDITTEIQAAALQVAIWEVVDDFGGTLDLTGGNFRLNGSSSIATQANTYLAAIPANVSSYVTGDIVLKSGNNPQSQNLLVPEPAAVLLSILSFPILGLQRRKI